MNKNSFWKKIISVLLIANIFCNNALVFADEIENDEEVNTPPLTDIAFERTFNSKTKMYKYKLSDETSFSVNVPNGVIINDSVKLNIPDKVEYKMTKDDEDFTYIKGEDIEGVGDYRLAIKISNPVTIDLAIDTSTLSFDEFNEGSSENDISIVTPEKKGEPAVTEEKDTGIPDGTEFAFHFKIIDDKSNNLEIYNLPYGYAFKEILVDEVPVLGVNKLNYYVLADEGKYKITIYDKTNPQVEFITEVSKDKILPVLKLDNVCNTLTTYSTVEVKTVGDDTTYTAKLSDEDTKAFGGKFSSAGLYKVTAEDEAGNTNEYTFRILYTMNISGYTVILIIVAIIIFLIIYIRYLKTHMRVS